MKNSSKGNEKLMGPLFPRLHVNDTEKGGPRAPPRNKMALYEQLSIPSQRFRTDKEYVTPHCTAQESVHDSRIFFSVQSPSSGHTAERPLKNHPRQDAPVSHFDQQNKLDEDEFTVPIFLHSRKDQYDGKYCHGTGKLSPSIQINSNYSSTLQDSIDGNLKPNDVMQVRDNAGRQNKCISEDSFQYSLYSKEAERSLQQRTTYEVNTPEDLLNHNGQLCKGTPFPSIQIINEGRGDEASETSALEFISVTEMSPDDVVGIIGLKHFWKARSEIVKQQKAFAFQVFELHRLIKVQKLIAGSPHFLLGDIAHISDVKKLPMKPPPSNILKHRNDFEKIPQKRERSSENVENTSVSWSSYPSQAHQWLIPIMSPTEGLVYKPCSGQGFTSPVYGGPGPPGSGNFHPPGYGVLASHHQYPGMGVPTYVPPAVPHGYFSVEHRDSFHLQSQNSGPNCEKAQARSTGFDNTIEGNNPLPLCRSPVTDFPSWSQNGAESVQQARVIRVVPHNRRSATESVARIFHSIQEERKQFDFV